MFRNEYEKALALCDFTMSQTNALLDIVEECFPTGREAFIEGWSDGVNSVCRFLYGDMLSHDEFEDDHPTRELGYPELQSEALSLLNGVSFDLASLKLSAGQAITRMKEEIHGAKVDAFIAAMQSLAAPRLYFFIKRVAEDGHADDYFVGKAAWWAIFLQCWNDAQKECCHA